MWHLANRSERVNAAATCVTPVAVVIFNTLRPRQNGRQTTFSSAFFFNENGWISISISLQFVPRGSINNIPTLVQVMAWRRPGDKPLSEPMMVRLPTHICVTRPQWVNCMKFTYHSLVTSRCGISKEINTTLYVCCKLCRSTCIIQAIFHLTALVFCKYYVKCSESIYYSTTSDSHFMFKYRYHGYKFCHLVLPRLQMLSFYSTTSVSDFMPSYR